ncbi:MAG: hypothetical protein NTX72_04900 [Candidatus Uhrbacteria bacterium]|nr:hypothetical protein [Candidatus Uhrbacteria bacterium]
MEIHVNVQQVLIDFNAIDQDPAAQRFWRALFAFLKRTEAPLLLDLTSDGFAIYVVDKEQPYASLRVLEEAGEIKCVRYSNIEGYRGQVGTRTLVTDQAKAARTYRRVVDYLLAE